VSVEPEDRHPHYDDGLVLLGYGVVAAVCLLSLVLAAIAVWG